MASLNLGVLDVVSVVSAETNTIDLVSYEYFEEVNSSRRSRADPTY